MDSVFEPVDFKAHSTTTTKTVSFPNGAIKKHQHDHPFGSDHHRRRTSPYRECLRNHAATLGGHAVDGCGEFLPSPSADPAVPTSLLCDACGCHRNFHRRVPDHHHQAADRRRRQDAEAHAVRANGGARSDGEQEVRDEEEEDDDEDDDDDGGEDGGQRSSPSPPPPPTLYSSAPHMLMALSSAAPAGGHGPVRHAAPLAAAGVAPAQPRKRSRTKFGPEQKERMHELSERLGWRMQKKDEGMVEECCRGIGVDKGVFKVWMHNNKHHFLLSRKADAASGSSGGGIDRIANVNGDNGHAIINGSSSSS